MVLILFWAYYSYQSIITGKTDLVHHFEYVHENYESLYDLINLKELSINTYSKKSTRNCHKLYSKKLTLDGITNDLTVFNIQGFVRKDVFNALRKESFLYLSLIYDQNEEMKERRMLYEVKEIVDGLEFIRGDENFIMRITMINLETLMKRLNLSELITDTKKLETYEKHKNFLKSLYDYCNGTEKNQYDFTNFIDEWSLDHPITSTRYEGFDISKSKIFFLSINRFLNELLSSKKIFELKKVNLIEIDLDDLVEHTFSIKDKISMITKKTNLSYNLRPEQFREVYKDSIASESYKLFKNIILFPPKPIMENTKNN